MAVAIRWVGAFAVAMSFSWLDSWRVWVFFAVEATIVGLAILFACWALGETRGRSLEHVRSSFFKFSSQLKLALTFDFGGRLPCCCRWITMGQSSETFAKLTFVVCLVNIIHTLLWNQRIHAHCLRCCIAMTIAS